MSTKSRHSSAHASPLTTLHLTLGYETPRELADAIIQATERVRPLRIAKAGRATKKSNVRAVRR